MKWQDGGTASSEAVTCVQGNPVLRRAAAGQVRPGTRPPAQLGDTGSGAIRCVRGLVGRGGVPESLHTTKVPGSSLSSRRDPDEGSHIFVRFAEEEVLTAIRTPVSSHLDLALSYFPSFWGPLGGVMAIWGLSCREADSGTHFTGVRGTHSCDRAPSVWS